MKTIFSKVSFRETIENSVNDPGNTYIRDYGQWRLKSMYQITELAIELDLKLYQGEEVVWHDLSKILFPITLNCDDSDKSQKLAFFELLSDFSTDAFLKFEDFWENGRKDLVSNYGSSLNDAEQLNEDFENELRDDWDMNPDIELDRS